MMIDGRVIKDNILKDLNEEIKNNNYKITLAIIQVGCNPSSDVYIRNKIKAANEIGIGTKHITIKEKKTPLDTIMYIKKVITELNRKKKITGIILQLPLPAQLIGFTQQLLDEIAFDKDVDNLSSKSIEFFRGGQGNFAPATAQAVLRVLKLTGKDLPGREVAVIGKGLTSGRPIAELLRQQGCYITVCDSKTTEVELKRICLNSDIIVSCVGKKDLVKKDYLDRCGVFVDVGIAIENGKMYGDCLEENKKDIKYHTRVPNGIGAITVAELLTQAVNRVKQKSQR